MSVTGKYEGRAAVEFLPDGRRVKLIEPFAYIDYEAERWSVPSGAIVDGASIPQPLWGVVGGPFEGAYRDASVIHDWYCDRRIRPWKRVHRVFYEAMLTSGVSKSRAKLMYAAVYWGGPRWSETVVANNILAALVDSVKSAVSGGTGLGFTSFTAGFASPGVPKTRITRYHYSMSEDDFNNLQAAMNDSDMDLAAVEHLVDEKISKRQRIEQ